MRYLYIKEDVTIERYREVRDFLNKQGCKASINIDEYGEPVIEYSHEGTLGMHLLITSQLELHFPCTQFEMHLSSNKETE
jgi:hypothetical protein